MSTTQGEAVRFDVTVEVPVERAFDVFTGQFDRIKPRDHNIMAPEAIVETVFETHVGGHVYDRGENGSICRWARVLAFEPPHRFVISWDISPAWQVVTDPAEASEVEVTFVAEAPRGPGSSSSAATSSVTARGGSPCATASRTRPVGRSTSSGSPRSRRDLPARSERCSAGRGLVGDPVDPRSLAAGRPDGRGARSP